MDLDTDLNQPALAKNKLLCYTCYVKDFYRSVREKSGVLPTL